MSENQLYSDYLFQKQHFEIIQQILKDIGESKNF